MYCAVLSDAYVGSSYYLKASGELRTLTIQTVNQLPVSIVLCVVSFPRVIFPNFKFIASDMSMVCMSIFSRQDVTMRLRAALAPLHVGLDWTVYENYMTGLWRRAAGSEGRRRAGTLGVPWY